MAFLKWIGTILVPLIFEKVVGLFSSWWAKMKAKKEAKKNAEASMKPLIDAQTGEQIHDATRSALDDL